MIGVPCACGASVALLSLDDLSARVQMPREAVRARARRRNLGQAFDDRTVVYLESDVARLMEPLPAGPKRQAPVDDVPFE